MTESKTKTLDEQLHEMDEANKIFEFAETVLGCNDKQADIMSRTMRHKFRWSGVRLLFNGGPGDEPVVAVDHVDRIREYFARENYDFLLPPPKVAVGGDDFSLETAVVPKSDIDDALNGSLTAKGRICLALGGNNPDAVARTELFLKAERAKRNGSTADTHPHGVTRAEGGGDRTSNPFLGAHWNLTEQSRLVRQNPELAARLAAKAGVRIGATKPARAT